MAPKYRHFFITMLLALGLDQGTKAWARQTLRRQVLTVVPGYFDLRYSENPGAAFSLLRDLPYQRYFFLAVGTAALIVISLYLRRAAPGLRRVAAELGLVAAGTLGNVLDRIFHVRVTDFILWKIGSHHWPVFNIADAALVLGAIGLFVDSRGDPRSPGPGKG